MAHVVYEAGTWNEAGMDNQVCDRHPSAKAKAKVTLPSGGVLYACGHCANTIEFGPDYTIEYETVSV